MFDSKDFRVMLDQVVDALNPQTATLTFPLPEYDGEFRTAVDGSKFKSVLWDLDQEMRTTCKHDAEPMISHHDGIELTDGERKKNSVIYTTTDYWRDRLWSLLGERNLDLWDE